MDPWDQHKTAFSTPFGLRECTTFQRLMHATMSDFMFQFLLVYLDDLVYSKTFDEHLEYLERLLRRVTETGLKLKLIKCQLLRRQVTYLGHIISAEGVSCEAGRVETVHNWPTPKTVIVGSHDRRSLQLFPKMYYYASPTLRSETTLPLKKPQHVG